MTCKTLSGWLDEKSCSIHAPPVSIVEITPDVKFWSFEGKFLMGGIKDPKFEHSDNIKNLIKQCKLKFHPDKGGDSDTLSEFIDMIKDPTEEDVVKLLRIMSSGLTIMDNNMDLINATTVDDYSYNFCFDLKQINKIIKKRLYKFSIMDIPTITAKTRLIMRTYEQYIRQIYSNSKDKHVRAIINGMNEIKRNFSVQNLLRMKQAISLNIAEICSSDEGHKTSKVVNGYCNIVKTFYECISHDPELIKAFKIDIITTGVQKTKEEPSTTRKRKTETVRKEPSKTRKTETVRKEPSTQHTRKTETVVQPRRSKRIRNKAKVNYRY